MGLIQINNLTIGYKEKTVLKNINLNIRRGEIVTFLGPNGSGKSTLMSTINGILKPLTGHIFINNKNINELKPKDLAKLISFVPQAHIPKFDYKVFDMVLTGRTPHINYVPKKYDLEKTKEAIEKIEIGHLQNKKYTELSGGERQLVIIARAIAQETKIILLDEPTSYLDLKNQLKVLKLIENINKENNITFIMTLHEPNHALAYSNKIVLINRDKIEVGTPEKIISKENIKLVYDVDAEIINHMGSKYLLPCYL